MSLGPSCSPPERPIHTIQSLIVYIITRLLRPPPVREGRPSFLAPLHQLDRFVCHIPRVSIPLPRPRRRFCASTWALPTLLHPLPTPVSFTALSSPLRQSTVLHFEPSARQVKAKRPAASAGNVLWEGRPEQTACTGPPEIATLFESHCTLIPACLPGSPRPRAQASQRSFREQCQRLAESTAIKPQPPNAEVHSSPTTPRQPG
ncbi:hypothetical protein diail_11679 [Diaporthe ilicicola]|nr:hypothetical protein diail_11679 [Diaporthe ilicicola]